MSDVIAFPTHQRPRGEARRGDAQILLFTGVWRERYDTPPAKRSEPQPARSTKRATKPGGAPRKPAGPSRGRKQA
jgi:hypothetical protein